MATYDNESQVIQDARADKWELVKLALLNNNSEMRVELRKEAQGIVLTDAMSKERWDVIADLIMGNYQFKPPTLDVVLSEALQLKNLNFMEKAVLLSQNEYRFNSNLLVAVLACFCTYDDWLPQAYELVNRLPLDTDIGMLTMEVYIPLNNRSTLEMVQVKNILNRIRIRFHPHQVETRV